MSSLIFRLLAILLIVAVPVVVSDVADAKNPKNVLKALDKNEDGRVGPDEWRKGADIFNKIDADGDGYLSLRELAAFFKAKSDGDQPSAAKPTAQPIATAAAKAISGWQGPIIDVHSQVDENTNLDEIVPLLDRAGVVQVILSTRFNQPSSDVIALAARYPDRIIPAAKTKSKAFMKNGGEFPGIFHQEIGNFDYRAMAEIIMWHAAKKGVGAGKAAMNPDDARVATMVDIARQKSWPFVAHVEFAAMGWDKSGYMEKFEALVSANRDLPIGMMHMGQLDAEDAARLLPLHPNLFFITSHSNPITTAASKLPWTRMFDGSELAPRWRDLLLAYPDRFVLAFDNVFDFHWRDKFLPQVEVWRKALAALPDDVAHALAHGNAERIWKLSPAILPN